MTTEVLEDECICAQCRSCRLAMKELDVRELQVPVERSETAERILAEGAYWNPARGVRTPRKDPAHQPHGQRSGRQILAEQRKSERVQVDGHWTHPSSRCPHGTSSAYRDWYCRCATCREFGARQARKYRGRRKAREMSVNPATN